MRHSCIGSDYPCLVPYSRGRSATRFSFSNLLAVYEKCENELKMVRSTIKRKTYLDWEGKLLVKLTDE